MTNGTDGGRESAAGRALARRMSTPGVMTGAAMEGSPRFDLSQPGEATVPHVIRDAVAGALLRGETHYTARTGIEPLRQRIAGLSSAEGFPATAGHVVVTNGGSEALFIALQALAAPGGRVVLIEPAPPELAAVTRFTGMTPDIVTSARDTGLEDAALIVVAAASGISGRVLPDEQLVETLELAARHGVTAVIDRSAWPDCYVSRPPFSRPDLAAEAITVGSFSGAYALDGWRAGYFTAPDALLDRLAGLKESMSISTTTPTQFAMLAALEHTETLLTDARAAYAGRLSRATGVLAGSGVPFVTPEVYPGLLIDIRQSGLDDEELARRLEAGSGVGVEPASRYGASLAGYIRVDLRCEDDALDEGLSRLAAFMTEGA